MHAPGGIEEEGVKADPAFEVRARSGALVEANAAADVEPRGRDFVGVRLRFDGCAEEEEGAREEGEERKKGASRASHFPIVPADWETAVC